MLVFEFGVVFMFNLRVSVLLVILLLILDSLGVFWCLLVDCLWIWVVC